MKHSIDNLAVNIGYLAEAMQALVKSNVNVTPESAELVNSATEQLRVLFKEAYPAGEIKLEEDSAPEVLDLSEELKTVVIGFEDFRAQCVTAARTKGKDAVKEAIASVGASKAADVAEADREKVLALLA